MTVRLAAILTALAIVAAAFAFGLDRVAVNPTGTDGVAKGKLIVDGDADRAPLNVTILGADPSAPQENEIWFVSAGSRHQGCFRRGAITYCWDATQTP